jgi:neopullulanase
VNGFPLRAYDQDNSPNYAAWWGLPALPKLNTDNPAVREFLWRVGQYWMEQGIDGWRLDVPGEIDDDEFWLEYRRRVKVTNPEAYIVGEIWGDARRWICGGQFDAAMNYLFARACMGFFLADTLDEPLTEGLSYAPVPNLKAPGFVEAIEEMLALYPEQTNLVQLNLFDSHDTARFLSLGKGDERALRLAVLFLITFVGAPCVYYGDEIGMKGGRDPDCRRGMIWDQNRWNTDILDRYKRAIRLRHERIALRRGSYTTLHTGKKSVVFGRRYESETCVVALNAGRSTEVVNVPVDGYLPDGAVLQDVWSGRTEQVVRGKLRRLKLAPQSGLVFDVNPGQAEL